MRYILFVLMSFVLISCSGSGIKNFTAINSMMQNETGKVFVGREKGYYNSAQVYTVNLNGKLLGKLGNGETIFGNSIKGSNILETPGVGGHTVVFEQKNNSNHYYLINYRPGAFVGSLKLLEVTESSFRNLMQ
jgi:hypothetical protein